MKEKNIFGAYRIPRRITLCGHYLQGMQCINVEQRVYHGTLIILDVWREWFGGIRDSTHNF
jgi:hypothetical protein